MERSQRIKRGFNRLAIAGFLVGLFAASAFDINAMRLRTPEIAVLSPKGNLLFPASMKDEDISKAMVAFAGAPIPQPVGEFAYKQSIAWARADRSTAVEGVRQIAYAWAIAAIVWVIFWLGLSWVMRGFMT